jgi:hypothetical protein
MVVQFDDAVGLIVFETCVCVCMCVSAVESRYAGDGQRR